MSELELVEVYRAKDSPQAHMLTFALEELGIKAVIQGDSLQAALGEVPLGWSTAPRIMVHRQDVDRARVVIAEFEDPLAAAGPGDSQDSEACLACGIAMTQDNEQCSACGWSYKEVPENGQDKG